MLISDRVIFTNDGAMLEFHHSGVLCQRCRMLIIGHESEDELKEHKCGE